MKLTELEFEGAQAPIDGYAPAGFRVAGQFFDGPVILDAAGVRSWPVGPDVSALDPAAARPFLAMGGALDVLLIGVGPETRPVPAAFRAALEAAELRFDAISTPAACRTYNVLLNEGRRVAAALLTTGGGE